MIGLNQKPGASYYPFRVYGENAEVNNAKTLSNYIKYIQISTALLQTKLPLVIKQIILAQNGTTGKTQIDALEITDSTGVSVFSYNNSRVLSTQTTTNYSVVTYINATNSSTNTAATKDNYTTKVILYLTNEVIDDNNLTIQIKDVYLDPRCCFKQFGTISHITATNIQTKNPTFYSGSNIKLENSNNIIRINYYPTQNIDPAASRLNLINYSTVTANTNAINNTGNLELTFDDCIKIEPYTEKQQLDDETTDETNTIRVEYGGVLMVSCRCKSCCNCKDIATTYGNDLTKLQERTELLYENTSNTQSDYKNTVAAIVAAIQQQNSGGQTTEKPPLLAEQYNVTCKKIDIPKITDNVIYFTVDNYIVKQEFIVYNDANIPSGCHLTKLNASPIQIDEVEGLPRDLTDSPTLSRAYFGEPFTDKLTNMCSDCTVKINCAGGINETRADVSMTFKDNNAPIHYIDQLFTLLEELQDLYPKSFKYYYTDYDLSCGN